MDRISTYWIVGAAVAVIFAVGVSLWYSAVVSSDLTPGIPNTGGTSTDTSSTLDQAAYPSNSSPSNSY